MTLEKTIEAFKIKVDETNKTNDIKLYNEFLRILTSLKERDLTSLEIKGIESELKKLNLDSEVIRNKQFYKKGLIQFEKYLMDTLSIVTKGYYIKRGISLGMVFGILFGIVFLSRLERSIGISLGIATGMFIGLLIVKNLDAKALASGKVI